MQVILASRSPRRLRLLQAAGLSVQVEAVAVNESPLPDEKAVATVQRLCRLKAAACPNRHLPVIAADTLVTVDGVIMGQPGDLTRAGEMLRRLSGREHEVYSGVCVHFRERISCATVRTRIRFRHLQEDEINCYLRYNNVLDKAGAYAIQAGASGFIDSVEGPLDNVIGLPVKRTLELLAETSA